MIFHYFRLMSVNFELVITRIMYDSLDLKTEMLPETDGHMCFCLDLKVQQVKCCPDLRQQHNNTDSSQIP